MIRHTAPPGTQAVVRALSLLRAFTPAQPELSLGELASFAGLTKSTAHRLLLALESQGVLDRRAGRFRLGPEVVALGSQALLGSDLRARVRPTLERLAAETGESASVEVLVGDRMLVLDGVRGRHLVAAELGMGQRWPLHATSSGKCTLAQLSVVDREALLTGPLERFTEHTHTDPDDVVLEFEGIRQRGYAVANQELEEGYVAVAAALFGPLGEYEGALCLGGPAGRFAPARIESLGELLHGACVELAQAR